MAELDGRAKLAQQVSAKLLSNLRADANEANLQGADRKAFDAVYSSYAEALSNVRLEHSIPKDSYVDRERKQIFVLMAISKADLMNAVASTKRRQETLSPAVAAVVARFGAELRRAPPFTVVVRVNGTDEGIGFVVHRDEKFDLVATARHMVAGDEDVFELRPAGAREGGELKAVVVGTDSWNDVSILKVPSGLGLPQAKLGKSTSLKPTDSVFLAGNVGAPNAVTGGTVGRACHVDLPIEGNEEASAARWIFHDVSQFGGSSGSPLLADDGSVVGMQSGQLRGPEAVLDRNGNPTGEWVQVGLPIGYAVGVEEIRRALEDVKAHGAFECDELEAGARWWSELNVKLNRECVDD